MSPHASLRSRLPPLSAAVSDSAPGGSNCGSHAADAFIAPDERYCLRLLDGIIREGEDIHHAAHSSHGGSVWSKFRFTKVSGRDAPGGGSTCSPNTNLHINVPHMMLLLRSDWAKMKRSNERCFPIVLVGSCGDFLPQIEPHQADVVQCTSPEEVVSAPGASFVFV